MAKVCIVLAHPDDETIALGGLLPRMRSAILVTVTDGAPRDLADATRLGFTSAADYAAARRHELLQVLSLARWEEGRLVLLGIPDQESAFHLPEIARSLVDLFSAERPDVVITHAYEGGHPDHDAVAFAVHAACALAARQELEPALIEVCLYHASGAGWVRQSFAPGHSSTLSLELGSDEIALKKRMIQAHATQSATLADFDVAAPESFRIAPAYDFTELPNGGRLLYERYDWGMNGAHWQELARQAIETLGLY
jgi:LmbE family N-acetylglucosaminyl deacetylase